MGHRKKMGKIESHQPERDQKQTPQQSWQQPSLPSEKGVVSSADGDLDLDANAINAVMPASAVPPTTTTITTDPDGENDNDTLQEQAQEQRYDGEGKNPVRKIHFPGNTNDVLAAVSEANEVVDFLEVDEQGQGYGLSLEGDAFGFDDDEQHDDGNGSVAQVIEVSCDDVVKCALLDQNVHDGKRQIPCCGQQLEHSIIQQQTQQQQQTLKQQHHPHPFPPHHHQQKFNLNHHQQQQQPITPNNASSLTVNRSQHLHQQQQGLVPTLPAIPAQCYVHQQISSSNLQQQQQTMTAVDFLQSSNQHQLFPITSPAQQIIGQMPTLHFPAINQQHQQHHQSVIVPNLPHTPQAATAAAVGATTTSTLSSPSFTNYDHQNTLCNGLVQHQHHHHQQQNIMQQIEWQIQLQKNHIRQQQQQQQQQLQNPRQNLHQHQLLHFQRQIQQQQHHHIAHHHHPHHHHHHHHHQQQQHNLHSILQIRPQQQNIKPDLLCPNMDNTLLLETSNDTFQNGQKFQSLLQQQHHQQQHPPRQQHALHQTQLQLKKQHKQEQQQVVKQSSTMPSNFESNKQQQQLLPIPASSALATAASSNNPASALPAGPVTVPAPVSATTATCSAGTTGSANQGVNLYVKHLDDEVDDVALKKMFSRFGEVVSAKVMMEGQMSRGFGFVCFAKAEDAARATRDIRRKLDDLSSMKNLYVAPAQRKEERQAIFREKLRSFMEDAPPVGVGNNQDNESKKFLMTPSANKGGNTVSASECLVASHTDNSKSLESSAHAMMPTGDNASTTINTSTNVFLKNPKTKTIIPSLQISSDHENQHGAQMSSEDGKSGLFLCSSPLSHSSMLTNSIPGAGGIHGQHQQWDKKTIFDLENFSLEKLNIPLLQTKVKRNSQGFPAIFQENDIQESQAEPIPKWFFETDEDEKDDDDDRDPGFSNMMLPQGVETMDSTNHQSGCYVSDIQSLSGIPNDNTESYEWASYSWEPTVCDQYGIATGEAATSQARFRFNCDFGNTVGNVDEDFTLGKLELETLPGIFEGNEIVNNQLNLTSWSRNIDVWNCTLITKEDNQIIAGEQEKMDEEKGYLEKYKENSLESLDQCKQLAKDCISCCTDTDSSISGDEDNESEYKDNVVLCSSAKCKNTFFSSTQNGQNNNSNVDEDGGNSCSGGGGSGGESIREGGGGGGCVPSRLSRWTKRRRRDSSSDEIAAPTTVAVRIHYNTITKSNTKTPCQVLVALATSNNNNSNKIRVLGLPMVMAPVTSTTRKVKVKDDNDDAKVVSSSRKRKWATSSLATTAAAGEEGLVLEDEVARKKKRTKFRTTDITSTTVMKRSRLRRPNVSSLENGS